MMFFFFTLHRRFIYIYDYYYYYYYYYSLQIISSALKQLINYIYRISERKHFFGSCNLYIIILRLSFSLLFLYEKSQKSYVYHSLYKLKLCYFISSNIQQQKNIFTLITLFYICCINYYKWHV